MIKRALVLLITATSVQSAQFETLINHRQEIRPAVEVRTYLSITAEQAETYRPTGAIQGPVYGMPLWSEERKKEITER